MKLVLDTNVLISGLLFGGQPETLLEAIKAGRLSAYTSEFLLAELTRILKTKFEINQADVMETERLLRETLVVVTPKIVPDILADKPDNQVLAISHEVKIEAIITGDKALLNQRIYQGVLILTVGEFLAEYKQL